MNSNSTDSEQIPIEQLVETALAAFSETAQRIGRNLQPVLLRIMALHEAVYEAYLEAGAPYGDSHDGLMRWLHEIDLATGEAKATPPAPPAPPTHP